MMPAHGSVRERLAAACATTVDDVDQVLLTHGLTLSDNRVGPRTVSIRRLRVRGEKHGIAAAGRFDRTFEFGDGVTVIVADNLRGKTSILEIITLALRGTDRSLQADVRSWLEHVALDVSVNGRPLGMRLHLDNGAIDRGLVLSGEWKALRDSDDAPTPLVAVVASVSSDEEWANAVARVMLRWLDLEVLLVHTTRPGQATGTVQAHGWPTYFGAIYPPAGADRVLLGETVEGGLATRLLAVFLDLPYAALRTRVRAVLRSLQGQVQANSQRDAAESASLSARRAEAERTLAAARVALAAVDAAHPAEDLRVIAEAAENAAALVAARRSEHDSAAALLSRARESRIDDQRRLLRIKESAVAGALFHGLNPASCPRCELSIDTGRRDRERDAHECAVCARPIAAGEEDQSRAEEEQAAGALEASEKAERAFAASVEKLSGELAAAQRHLDEVDSRLKAAEAAHRVADRAAAELAVAAAEGTVRALEPVSQALAPRESPDLRVLQALDQMLANDSRDAGRSLFAELNEEVADLARGFGMDELEAVDIRANATMGVQKGGGARSTFIAQSAGERLRLRFAVVLGLLRVARQHNIASHPGVLLLDSLKAEEIQDADALQLLEAIVEVAAGEHGVQVIATTADARLASKVAGVGATISPNSPGEGLF